MAAAEGEPQLPVALGKLSQHQRDSLKEFITNLLLEWGEVNEEGYAEITQTYGLEKKDSEQYITHLKEDGEFAALDLESKKIKIGKSEYELGAVLGSGKYAEVRRGRHADTRKLFALKFLFVDGSRREVRLMRDQMRDELRAFKKISHTNVVRLHAFDCRNALSYKGKAEGRPCMIQVQELCKHGELYDYVQYNGRFPEKLARAIMYQFAEGLKACHLAGIVHRDLKPDNILLDADYRVKICDFGFAKSFVKGEGNKRRVYLKTILGTAGYMSPEMLMKMHYNEKTDIFSAGVILFILLAGYPPLQTAEIGDWWFERLLEGRHSKFWKAHEQGQVTFSDSVKKLIVNMLEPNPSERYSVLDVLESDWMKEERYDKNVYRAHMKQMKVNVDRSRADKRNSAMNRDVEIDSIKRFVGENNKIGWKPTLRRLCENKYVHSLSGVQTKGDLITVLNTVEDELSCQDVLRMNLQVNDPAQASQMLATAEDVSALKKVLNVDDEILAELQKALKPLTKTAVDGHIKGMGGSVHPNFFALGQIPLPVFDPTLHDLPLHSYRFRCGMDILCFALRFVTKAFDKCAGRLNPSADQTRPGLAKMQFKLKRENRLPLIEEIEMSDEELSRRRALGLPLESSKTTGGYTQEIKYLLNLEIQCYQDPNDKDLMIATIQRVEKAEFQASDDLQEIVETILHKTCLAAFLVEEQLQIGEDKPDSTKPCF